MTTVTCGAKELLATNETEAYDAMCSLIHYTVRKFQCAYGGMYEDLVGEANYMFVLACRSHDAAKSKLSAWIHNRIWYGLLAQRRDEKKHTDNTISMRGYENDIQYTPDSFLLHFMEKITEESRDVVNLIVDTPDDMLQMALDKGGQPKNLRSSLRQHLHSNLGWTHSQIKESFREIKEALRG